MYSEGVHYVTYTLKPDIISLFVYCTLFDLLLFFLLPLTTFS